jgi:thiol-disulfide isomerase/thioredoxin
MRAKSKKEKQKKAVNDGIDVATEADIPKLLSLLKSTPIVLVLVHADWCGHCQTFKPTWENYKNTKGRTVPMASINEKVLAKTPLRTAKLDGYPSTLLYSGKDGSYGSFTNDKGEQTHAIPNARDPKIMSQLLRVDPSMLKQMSNKNTVESESAQSTPEANMLLEQSGKRAIKEIDRPIAEMNDPLPPNTSTDVVQPVKQGGARPKGGSLLDSIMRYVGEFVQNDTRRRKRRAKIPTRKARS